MAFIHRFGSSLKEHVHFHVCVVDGVFEEVAGGTNADTDDQSSERITKVPPEPTTACDGVPGFTPGNSAPTQPKPAPPRRSQARYLWVVLIARIYEVFPPLWEVCDAPVGEGLESEPDWDTAAQSVPKYEVDQRINW